MKQSEKTALYTYYGPVFNNNDAYVTTIKDSTHAESVSKACNNLRYKIAKRLNRKVFNTYIDNSLVVQDNVYPNPVVSDPKYNFEDDIEDSDSPTFVEAYDSLSNLYEELLHKTLVRDVLYANIEDFFDKRPKEKKLEVLMYMTKSNPQTILKAFSDAGLINKDDDIVLPKGTVLNYVTTRELCEIPYDIFYVKGKRNCLVAFNVHSSEVLFDKDDKEF